ncbi:MAG: hypothetical protein JRJ47_00350 [Deltaproteobacteria bacterium]|nr:hypothetical protein [Deltaproteobacteria bacterium]
MRIDCSPEAYVSGVLEDEGKTRLKNVDQASGQGAGRRKSGAYTVVCEHFEPTRNAAMGP